MTIAETTFDDAIRTFTAFLAENGMDTRILWVFTEDVYSRKTDLFITDFWLKIPVPVENEEFARRHFDMGKTRGFGLGLTAFASCDEGVCCSFVLPSDDEDAQYMLMDPQHLKYSYVNRDMPVAKVVRSKFFWSLLGVLRFWVRPGNHFVYLASKAKLMDPGIGAENQ